MTAYIFEESDYLLYRDLLQALPQGFGRVLGLPPDAQPHASRSGAGNDRRACPALDETLRRYTAYINVRARWTGHLFQGRFASVKLDDEHLMAAARYVALNPVRVRLVARPHDWAWSSVRAHLAGRDNFLLTVTPLIERLGRIEALIDTEPEGAVLARLRAAETTGRPLGSDDFVARLEARMRRTLRPQKPGRKPKPEADTTGDLFAANGK